MTARHTSGPWMIRNRAGGGYGKEFEIYTRKGPAFKGDQLSPDGKSIAEARANAELAAAAPELLEALSGLLQHCQPAAKVCEQSVNIALRDAIEARSNQARAILSRLGAA